MAWLGSLAGVVILVAGFGIWRLMQGPIELDRLVPYVEQALAASGGNELGVKISGVRLGLDRTTHELHLWAENVRVALPNGEQVARFPEMATSFSPGALLRGRLLPAEVSVQHAIVHLKRHESGGITFRVGNGGDDTTPDVGLQLVDQLLFEMKQGGTLGPLRRVRIRDATVILDDKVTGQRWRATRVDAAMRRDEQGAHGDISLAFPLGESTPELHASFSYAAPTRKLDVTLNADGVDPVAIASLFPEARPLAQIHAPVAGTLTTRIDLAAGNSEGIRLDLSFGPGRWTNGILPAGFLEAAGGELHALYAPETSELRLERFALNLGNGSRATIEGTLDGVSPDMLAGQAPPPTDLAGKLGVKVTQLPIARLDKIWPAVFSPGGRRWFLANVRDGVLDEATAQLALKINAADYSAQVVTATGQLRYHDATVSYFGGLPPVRKVAGTADFAGNRLEFLPTTGILKSTKVTGGSIELTDLGAPTEWATVDLNLSGTVQDALEVIDNKPLHYAQAVGLDPAQVGGRAETQLHFHFPLVSDLKFDAIEYGVKASLSGVSIAKAALDHNLTDGNLALEIGAKGAHLQGDAQFDGVPIKLDGDTLFRHGAAPKTRYHVALRLDQEARRRLGLDVAEDVLSGTVGAEVTYSADEPGHGAAVATIDLSDGVLALPDFGWQKPARVPGMIKIVLDINKDVVSKSPEVEVKAPGLDGRFALTFAPDHHQIDRVDIRRLVLGTTDIAGIVTRRADGWRADLRGPRFDAGQLLKQTTPPGTSTLQISGRFDRVQLSPHSEVTNVVAQMLRRGGSWQSIQVNGRYANSRWLDLQIAGDGGPVRRLAFQSNDLGATMSLLGISDNIVGGEVRIDGQIVETGGKRTLRGHLEGSNYSLVRAPSFARVLGMASFDGAAQSLSGGGVPFSVLRADFTYDGSNLGLDRAVAYGGSIGVTANGWYDLDRDRLELQGSIAPAYALNSLLGIGNLPLIGQILTGGEGQGLLAANYRLSGPAGNPQVSVNPLSALAPGFLRQLFQFALPPAQAQQTPPQPGQPQTH